MGIQIEDGKGTGILAAVSDENLIRTLSETGPTAGHVSNVAGNTYSVIGTANVVSGIVVALHIVNNDPTLIFALDRCIVEGVSISGAGTPNTPIPNQGAFFSLGYNRTVSSGGTSSVPTTLNRTSVTVANVTAIAGNPNMNATPTFVESHRWYIQANGIAFELIRPEVDDIILGRTNTMEIRYTSDNTSGTVIAIAKFIMVSPDDLP